MPRPLIGITTYVEESTRYGVWDLPTSLVPAGYYELVQAAGGAAVLLPPDDSGTAAEVLGRLDGLVVRPRRAGPAAPPRRPPTAAGPRPPRA
ncbi:gamma-glutamyl-gamma-aminobutyrate hydrolase family protein, partial [Streptomyces sp. NPDC006341]|uniref:gamma-glutamyl-gamma-aminobutyrate hydrolase family protein n=1 Tax=Streptomyces sp. NPDC006341 TaxID=3156756 RepID=UPI0033B3C8D4